MGDGGAHLELRTDAANYHFENWRLAHDIVHEARRHALTARVFEVVGGPDFVHARLSAFHNHLTRYRSALYFFTGGEDIINLHRVVPQTGQGFELVCSTCPRSEIALCSLCCAFIVVHLCMMSSTLFLRECSVSRSFRTD